VLIPDNIEKFDSRGEQLLFLKFKNDPGCQRYYVLHSLFTNFHFTAPSGELDFLVLAPNLGFFAIEVKHGRVIRDKGAWYFGDDSKERQSSKSPFAQVNGTMNSVRQFLLSKIKDENLKARYARILFGSGVAFTSMNELIDVGPEAFPWQILTRQGMNLPITSYIQTLSVGWHGSHRGKAWYDANHSRPTDDDCQRALAILRGDFNVDYSAINRLVDHEFLIDEFTKEQFGLLDFVNFNNRVLVQGPAGTGKTLMALELARRMIAKQKTVALVCFNNQLAAKLTNLTKHLSNQERLYCGTLHSLMIANIGGQVEYQTDPKFFSEILPIQFVLNEANPEAAKYDYLIVDEAQDVLAPYFMEALDLVLKGGLRSGNWMIFGDFSNQAIYLEDPDKSLETLSQKSSYVNFPPLRINCRNTKKVALHNTLVTGISKPEFRSKNIDGDPIDMIFCDEDQCLEKIEDLVKKAKSKGVDLKCISILLPKKSERSLINDSEYLSAATKEGLTITTIHSYKGLENSFIILCDFDEIHSIESKRLLYIGISRARLGLTIVLSKKLEQSYTNLVTENLKLII
jgi:DNA polymerase III delta prime subunit